jgi:DNA processing protein
MSDKSIIMALAELGGVGPRTFQQLLMRFGSPENLLNAGEEDLHDIPRVSEDGAERILKSLERSGEFENRLKDFEALGIEAFTYLDDDYPSMLREIGDPPIIVYMRGDRQALKRDYVALVGTTEATQEGIRLAVDMAKEFAKRGIGVISGLAIGIDSAAHLGSLKAGGATIAVLGCGFMNIFPAENETLADNITRTGLLVSEYQPMRRVRASQLVLRNRLISGLAKAVVLVQVGEKRRGELRTAEYALKQGKPLFITDPENALDAETIRNSNALLIEGVEAVDKIIDYMV